MKYRLSVDRGESKEGLYVTRNNQKRQKLALLVANRKRIASALLADSTPKDRAVFTQSNERIATAMASTQIGTEYKNLTCRIWRA